MGKSGRKLKIKTGNVAAGSKLTQTQKKEIRLQGNLNGVKTPDGSRKKSQQRPVIVLKKTATLKEQELLEGLRQNETNSIVRNARK